MSKSYIRLGLAGAVMLTILATALHFSNENSLQKEGLTNADQSKADNSATLQTVQTEPDQVTEEHDTRYQGDDSTAMITAVSIPASEYLASSMYGDFPLSMKGTAIPSLYLDNEGNLIQDKHAKDFIEYFISGAREEGNYTAVGRMQEYFGMTLDEPALSQALTLLDNYMDYRLQLDNVVSRDDIILHGDKKMTVLQETLERRKALRRETLGHEAAQAMFGDSEKYESYAVNMLQATQDPSLTKDQKLARFAEYEASLPEHIREKVRYKREEQLLDEKIKHLKQQGNKESEIFELRKAFYGEKPAKRLAFMDEKSDEWLSRVQQFNQQKQQILASVIMNEQQKRQQINDLRSRHFNEDEKMKLAWQALQ